MTVQWLVHDIADTLSKHLKRNCGQLVYYLISLGSNTDIKGTAQLFVFIMVASTVSKRAPFFYYPNFARALSLWERWHSSTSLSCLLCTVGGGCLSGHGKIGSRATLGGSSARKEGNEPYMCHPMLSVVRGVTEANTRICWPPTCKNSALKTLVKLHFALPFRRSFGNKVGNFLMHTIAIWHTVLVSWRYLSFDGCNIWEEVSNYHAQRRAAKCYQNFAALPHMSTHTCWHLRHHPIYRHFAQHFLSVISPNMALSVFNTSHEKDVVEWKISSKRATQ